MAQDFPRPGSDSRTAREGPAHLVLPPAALHARHESPHPDSEEFCESDRHRTAQELSTLPRIEYAHSVEPVEHIETVSLDQETEDPISPSIHSSSSSNRSDSYVRNRRADTAPSRASQISTAPDEGSSAAASSLRLRRQIPRWYDGISRFWKQHVSIVMEEGSFRDHLALERTFLAYLRTSLAFAITGVLIAQLFRLQHSLNPNLTFGFFVLGIPLSTTFECLAIAILLLGALRFWRQQQALVKGKVISGGPEVMMIMGLAAAVLVVTFFLLVIVDVMREYK